ncbi:MAG: Rpn family recombination-promoting nuclease/putative transposase [Cyanophyceae cyanobacterium]
MASKADIGSKRLVGLNPQSWVRWITQNPQVVFQEMLNSEFQWVSREGDVLIRAWDPQLGEFLIANEIQLRYSPEMPRRMRAYAALAEEKFKLPVYPVLVVILPGPDGIPTQYTSRLGDIEARQDYKVIQLSDVDAELVLEQSLPTLLPFVPIMRGGESEAVIRAALRQLQRDPVLSELESLLAFFARFVLDSEIVAQILRWDMAVLRESPWYEEIKQEGIQIGKQEGIQIGEQRGEQRGKQAAVPVLAELGLSAEVIAQRLGLPPELVAQILEH